MADPEKRKKYLYGDDDEEEGEPAPEDSLPPLETKEKKPAGPTTGQITEAIREGFARALEEGRIPLPIYDFLMTKSGDLDNKLINLAGQKFENMEAARQGAYYYMNTYVLPAARYLGFDILQNNPSLWYTRLTMVLDRTKREFATMAEEYGRRGEEPDSPTQVAQRLATEMRGTFPLAYQVSPAPGVKPLIPLTPPGEPDLVAEGYAYPARRTTPKPPPESPFTPGWMPFQNRWQDEGEVLPPGYVAPGGPQTIGEQIATERAKRENYALAMENAGYVPSVNPQYGLKDEYGNRWVRPGERGSREAEEVARQQRAVTSAEAARMIQAAQTAADERQAKYAQEERIAAQVAPSSVARSWAAPASLASYTGTVPKEMTAREAFEVGRGNLGALEALASGGREAYENALLGHNIEQKFGQARLRSEFPTPSAGYETSIAGQWGGGNPVEISQKIQAAREPWTARRMAAPLAAQEPELWEKYAAPRTYGWEKGAGHVAASSFSAEEPFDMPFEDVLKKRLAAKAAPALRVRSLYKFGGR